jgi:aspartate kinase
MALIVQKYGGTSVGSIERIRNVAERVAKFKMLGHQVVVVLSAMSGETNRLIGLAKEIQKEPDPRELDVLISTGEQVTIGLLAIALHDLGLKAKSFTGWQVPITTDNAHTKARIEHIDDKAMRAALDSGHVVVVAGFQGIDAEGNITTLGRGGSDTTGVALAAALHADECQIYTDVDGVYTTDPRVVPEARKLDTITFEEMLELASLGLQGAANPLGRIRRQIQGQIARAFQLRRRRRRHPHHFRGRLHGTSHHLRHRLQPRRSQAHHPRRARQAGHRRPHPRQDRRRQYRCRHDRPERRRRRHHRLLLHRASRRDEEGPGRPRRRSRRYRRPRCRGDDKIAKVSVVGVGMRTHAGVASKMFKALAAENINIQMISTSEIKISVLVDDKYMELAVRTLHQVFELDKEPSAT